MAELNIMQRLAKIRTIAEVVQKNKQGHNYTYSDIIEILAKITAGMKKYNVSLVPSIIPGTMSVTQNEVVNTKFDRTGKPYDERKTEMLINAEMSFKWVNDENPNDYIKVDWIIVGAQKDPSQAFGSALTYCTRYFLCNYFQIAQDNDVDKYRSSQKDAEDAEERAIAEGIIDTFDKQLKAYLMENEGKADEVKKFVKKYVKNADYFAIKEPALAAKLLEDFGKQYAQ